MCLICSTQTTKLDYEVKQCVSSDARGVNTSLSHFFCTNCGYIFVDFDKRVNYEKFYVNDYTFLLDGDVEPVLDDGKYSENLVEFYQEVILNESSKKFLDIGAGKGNFAQAMHNKFFNLTIVALEPSKSYVHLVSKKFIKETHNCFFDSKNFTTSFDYLSLIGVLEHVPNPKLFLLDLKEIMHDHSLLLIEVPNFKNNKADLLTIDHLSKFTEESLINLFTATGFDVLKKRVTQSVPMQFIVQKKQIERVSYLSTNVEFFIKSAIDYIKKAIDDAVTINDKQITIYGQGLILDYLVYTNTFLIKNIACIIDDNKLYQGKKYKDNVQIVDYVTFNQKYSHIDSVYLAMNDCYHNNVKDKLSNLHIYGVVE